MKNYRCSKAQQQAYRKALARARLGDNIANHMGYIYINLLYDKFDFTFKQVTNFTTMLLRDENCGRATVKN